MQLQQTIKSFIRPGEQSGYIAECLEISVITQGETLDEVVQKNQHGDWTSWGNPSVPRHQNLMGEERSPSSNFF
jgi:hypothetical protein